MIFFFLILAVVLNIGAVWALVSLLYVSHRDRYVSPIQPIGFK